MIIDGSARQEENRKAKVDVMREDTQVVGVTQRTGRDGEKLSAVVTPHGSS